MINMNQYICSKIFFVWRNSNSLQTVLVVEFSFGITGIFKMNSKIFKNLAKNILHRVLVKTENAKNVQQRWNWQSELNIIFYYEAKQHSTNIIFDKSTYTEDLFRNIHNRALWRHSVNDPC